MRQMRIKQKGVTQETDTVKKEIVRMTRAERYRSRAKAFSLGDESFRDGIVSGVFNTKPK